MSGSRFDVFKKSRLNWGHSFLTKALITPVKIGMAIHKESTADSQRKKENIIHSEPYDHNFYVSQLNKADKLLALICDSSKESVSLHALTVLNKLASIVSSYNSGNATREEDFFEFVNSKLQIKISTLKTESAKNDYRLASNLVESYCSDNGINKFKETLSSIL